MPNISLSSPDAAEAPVNVHVKELEIVFTDPRLPDIPSLNRAAVSRISPGMLRQTLDFGTRQQHGSLTAVTIGTPKFHSTLKRVSEWLTAGVYEPFNRSPGPNFRVRIASVGASSSWLYDSGLRAEAAELEADAQTTTDCTREMSLYFDCLAVGFTDLASESYRNLIRSYPIYADQIVDFVNHFRQ